MVDNLKDGPKDDSSVQSTGKIEGKTVKKLSNDEKTGKVFKKSIDKPSQ